ncbi:MAG: hypothetical protein S4CHLAM37_02390 [Chlamydiia bacterium]|nr:hypothetical protein [Chlamydiia bacterium]
MGGTSPQDGNTINLKDLCNSIEGKVSNLKDPSTMVVILGELQNIRKVAPNNKQVLDALNKLLQDSQETPLPSTHTIIHDLKSLGSCTGVMISAKVLCSDIHQGLESALKEHEPLPKDFAEGASVLLGWTSDKFTDSCSAYMQTLTAYDKDPSSMQNKENLRHALQNLSDNWPQ